MEKEKIKELVSKMTLEEKAGLCSGKDFWNTKDVKRLGIPSIMLSDGPHGLRKQEKEGDHLGVGESVEAVCFPAGCLTGASFDEELLYELGETLGNECQAENIGVLLGPAMNIKRSPLCGRNFEYYSEDPCVSSKLAASYIKGVQSKHIGTSPKHFLGNNQEHRRMTSSSNIDERTLREIYLASFETAVKEAKPWTIMASYNAVNHVYASEHRENLTDVLRNEWEFDGFVVSDWGAVNHRVEGLFAGLDLEMPGSKGVNDKKIMEAVKSKQLNESVLDNACERILDVVFRYWENRNEKAVYSKEKDHKIAKRIAEESVVLLKNEGILPLTKDKKIAVIGEYAKSPRYQGGGSSHINAYSVVSFMDKISDESVFYAKGYCDADETTDETLIQEAVEISADADVAVLFVGLPERYESEGFDRLNMKLPANQTALIDAVCGVQKNVVVVLHNGSPVEMPWEKKVKGILECYLAGEAVGEVQYDILFGNTNPSGKLAETFPIRLEDNPTYLTYGLDKDDVDYKEGIFVGYRYYDGKNMNVLYPFGHGLSYTEFSYSDLEISKNKMKDTESVDVSFLVKNEGTVFGKEVVQLYVSSNDRNMIRPQKELKRFKKISLNPGEQKRITFTLKKRDFAYWNVDIHDWHVLTGEYFVCIGASSRDIRLESSINVESTTSIPLKITLDTPFGDIFSNPKTMEKAKKMFSESLNMEENKPSDNSDKNVMSPEMIEAMLQYMPVRSFIGFMGIPEDKVEDMVSYLNDVE